jgi:hypothetical protein
MKRSEEDILAASREIIGQIEGFKRNANATVIGQADKQGVGVKRIFRG